MNDSPVSSPPLLAPRHEHSFGVYARYAPLLNAAIEKGETYLDPVEVSKTGQMKPYTLVVALRAALVAKRKYFYKVNLPIDLTDSRDFKIRETQDGRVAVFYVGNKVIEASKKLMWPESKPQLQAMLLPAVFTTNSDLHIIALSDHESEIREFVNSINPALTISFEHEWSWKVEKVL